MGTAYYRMISGNLGIYAAVDRDCPKDDNRRAGKPDGGWLPKAGTSYPGSVSFWTENGLNKYIDSGLLDWHASVVNDPVFVYIAEEPSHFLYEDDFQIICNPDNVTYKAKIPLDEFFAGR